jgi:hypothetical protein
MTRLLAALLLAASAVVAAPQPAACVACFQSFCTGSCAGNGCVCMFPPGEVTGSCWGASAVPDLLERGYTRAGEAAN